ncbi:MAG: dTDP-4-dehydrorhamnose 3,5-epimerase [Chlamydiia bacterium]|nr:dTDP-4-dehydrorhamnose 3,5-epimerase [Chlamydiia bacterium]
MEVELLSLQGVKKIRPRIFQDERGFFFESYRQPLYADHDIQVLFVQDNVSFSQKHTVRGLHFQKKPGQHKLISCLMGQIWDVFVDIRKDSPTFGQWQAAILDEIHREQLFIPIGFAHGFCVLSETALIQYKVSAIYDPENEAAIRWDDPQIGIAWPTQTPLLSLRDQNAPLLKDIML